MASSGIDIKIKTGYDGRGAKKAKADVNDLRKGISTLAGGLGGAMGQLKNLVDGFFTGGIWAAGAAAVKIAFDVVANSATEAADKVAAATRRMADAMHEKFAEAKAGEIDKLASSAANATAQADAAAKAYDNLAKAVGNVASAVAAAEKAQGRKGLSELAAEKERAVGGAANRVEADRIAADYDIKIAQARADLARRENAANAEASRRGVEDAKKQLDIAKARVAEASRARAEAKESADRYKDGPDRDLEKTSARALAETEKSVAEAQRQLKAAKADYAAAIAKERQAAADGDAAATDANTEVERAKRARRELVEAQAAAEAKAAKEAAKERDRLDRELHQRRMADLRAEIEERKKAASPLQAVASAAQTEFERAFAMYRDPSRAASEIAEERDRAEDLKQLHKDANRYGGRWRIDELSQLMAAGDSQSVQSRLEDWRKSKSFSPQVEAMVRASAAERTRTTAEEQLRKIEHNTSGLAEKLDELLGMKG